MSKLLQFLGLFTLTSIFSFASAGVYMGTGAVIDPIIPSTIEVAPPPGCVRGQVWPCYEVEAAPLIIGEPGAVLVEETLVPAFTATIRGTSLKENVARIVKKGPWKNLVWKLPYDYKWVGKAVISAPSIQDVLAKILDPYALQAVFYEANHVVVVQPRIMHNV